MYINTEQQCLHYLRVILFSFKVLICSAWPTLFKMHVWVNTVLLLLISGESGGEKQLLHPQFIVLCSCHPIQNVRDLSGMPVNFAVLGDPAHPLLKCLMKWYKWYMLSLFSKSDSTTISILLGQHSFGRSSQVGGFIHIVYILLCRISV